MVTAMTYRDWQNFNPSGFDHHDPDVCEEDYAEEMAFKADLMRE